MRVNTFELVIEFTDGLIRYRNLSRAAVQYYIDWYKGDPEYQRAYYGNNLLMYL